MTFGARKIEVLGIDVDEIIFADRVVKERATICPASVHR
jgi:hypothetical protein